jgi:hypothetical protein
VDLGPLRSLAAWATGGSVTRFTLITAAGLVIAVAAVGIAEADPYDGILRGLPERGCYLGAYPLLGGYLGLRR